MSNIRSEFCILDVLGPDGALLKDTRRGQKKKVMIIGTITAEWGDHDGTSREYQVLVDTVTKLEE